MIYLDPIYRLSLKVQVQAQRRKDVPFSAESESEIGQTSSGNVAERADLIGNCKQVTSAAQRWVRPRVTASLAMLKFFSGSSTAGVTADTGNAREAKNSQERCHGNGRRQEPRLQQLRVIFYRPSFTGTSSTQETTSAFRSTLRARAEWLLAVSISCPRNRTVCSIWRHYGQSAFR